MIYVEENSYERQLELLSALSDGQLLEIVIWLYPESTIGSMNELNFIEEGRVNAEPVTRYEKGVVARCTERIPFDSSMVDMLRKNKSIISENCDSLCIYVKDKFEWLACTIGHEGMSLVKDENFLNEIIGREFSASRTPPDWW